MTAIFVVKLFFVISSFQFNFFLSFVFIFVEDNHETKSLGFIHMCILL